MPRLTWDQVNAIRELLKEELPNTAIAKKLNISEKVVSGVKTGRHWYNPNVGQKGGRPISDTCKRGHKWTKSTERWVTKKLNGVTIGPTRECRICSSIRDRKYYKASLAKIRQSVGDPS